MPATATMIPPTRRDVLLCLSGMAIMLTGSVVSAMLERGVDDPAARHVAAQRLSLVPEVIGDWTSTPGQIDERERRLAEIEGSVRREYRHNRTGDRVTLTILSGASGPMSVHPPTACFEGVGYVVNSETRVVTITDRSGTTVSLNRAAFCQSEGDLTDSLRVFWGWSTDGQWEAPANPRLAWRGESSLYKLYVVDRQALSDSQRRQAETFLEEALPAIRQALIPRADKAH